MRDVLDGARKLLKARVDVESVGRERTLEATEQLCGGVCGGEGVGGES